MTKKAILLANLGSPDSTAVSDVRKYLREFLMDRRVIDIPKFLRFLLVNGIIVPFRARHSAKKYKSIWTRDGAPLTVLSKKLIVKVAAETGLPTYLCMRYGNPTPQSTLKRIKEEHPEIDEVVLFPLYPHYAMSSYETAVEHVKNTWERSGFSFNLKVVDPYYNKPSYIKTLAGTIRPYVQEAFDYILFSYHGVPERHILKSDVTRNHCLKSDDCCRQPSETHRFCYRHQVFETTRLVAEQLQLPEKKYSVSFQSRLGSDKWLGPATADVLRKLPERGIKKLLVVTPAFVSDCLETLEEIRIEGKKRFMEAGGETLTAIPCLNLDNGWVNAIGELIDQEDVDF